MKLHTLLFEVQSEDSEDWIHHFGNYLDADEISRDSVHPGTIESSQWKLYIGHAEITVELHKTSLKSYTYRALYKGKLFASGSTGNKPEVEARNTKRKMETNPHTKHIFEEF